MIATQDTSVRLVLITLSLVVQALSPQPLISTTRVSALTVCLDSTAQEEASPPQASAVLATCVLKVQPPPLLLAHILKLLLLMPNVQPGTSVKLALQCPRLVLVATGRKTQASRPVISVLKENTATRSVSVLWLKWQTVRMATTVSQEQLSINP